MKFAIRYVLLLSLLLVGRYGYMHAPGAANSAGCHVSTVFKEKNRLKAIEISVESDDELPSGKKKQPSPGNYFSSFFYAVSPAQLNYALHRRNSSDNHFFYSDTPRYVLYGVFRI